MRVSEKWLDLKNDDHEKFAKAAMRCRHRGAFCVADGFCHYGGDCFNPSKRRAEVRKRIRELEAEIACLRG